MGTTWSACGYLSNGTSIDVIKARLEDVFARCNHVFSLWDDTSFIYQFNAAKPGDMLEIPDEFRAVWRGVQGLCGGKKGGFDPFCAVEVSRRGYNPQIDAGGSGQDVSVFDLNLGKSFVPKPDWPAIDLNAIAKGYAVDCMAQALQELGSRSFIVEIGGEFWGMGLKEDHQPWWVDIESGEASPELFRVALVGFGLATSGNYHKQALSGQKTGHIVFRDEANAGFESVSVLHPDCMMADAWATALFSLGEDAFIVAEQEELAALFKLSANEFRFSSMLKSHFLEV